MANYLDRVAAAGARVTLEAQPSPAALPVLPSPLASNFAHGEDSASFHPAMENRGIEAHPDSLHSTPITGTILRKAASSASIGQAQNISPSQRSEPAAPFIPAAVRTPATSSVPAPVSLDMSSQNTDAVRIASQTSADLARLSHDAQPAASSQAPPRTLRPPDRIPRIVPNRPSESPANRVSLAAALASLSVPLSTAETVTAPSRMSDHSAIAAEQRSELSSRGPGVEPADSTSFANTPRSTPAITVSPVAPAYTQNSRSAEAEPRISIGRVDVLVHNQLPAQTVAASVPPTASSSNGLRARFMDRFTLRP